MNEKKGLDRKEEEYVINIQKDKQVKSLSRDATEIFSSRV